MVSCFSDSILVLLICMLVLSRSWFLVFWLDLDFPVHESGENTYPCIFSLTKTPRPEPRVLRGMLG